ncbi:neutral amino acid transporter [Podila epigama]|nr:neutral amino acid transporter [Podila epigama]
MTSVPRSIRRSSVRGATEGNLFSSSPRLDAATRLLSSSPSPSLARLPSNSYNNNNSNNYLTPSSSWRSPSTLHNFRPLTTATDGYMSGGENSNGIPIAGSYHSVSSVLNPADGSYSGIEIPPDEAAKVIKKHLVLCSPSARNSFDSDSPFGQAAAAASASGTGTGHDTADESGNDSESAVDYNTAFKLPGGAITRDVYKWQADQENDLLRRGRSKSFYLPRPVEPALTSLREPGGMRRYHMIMKAEASGRQANLLTRSFIDFLAMYGHFAGEDLDDEEGGDFEPAPYDEEDVTGGAGSAGTKPPGDENTPLIPRPQQTPQGDATPSKAVFLLLKSFVGTGIMFLPKAFENGGILFSSIVLIAIAAISLLSFLLLVESRQVVPASFGDIGGHLYGPYMRWFVLFSVAVSQVGFVCAYMSFVATNLEALAHNLFEDAALYPSYFFVLIQLVAFIPLAMIRNITRLSFTAVIADVFICFGLIYLYYYDIFTIASSGIADVVLFNKKDFALFVGTAVFTFEGIGLIIPISESMKEPEKFPKVLTGVMIGITVLFTSLGALSYATFGSETKTVILLNLPQQSRLVHTVQGLYSIAIMLSIPLQLFPAIRIMETCFFTKSGKYNLKVKWQKNTFRVVLLFICAAIAIWAGPDLDKFVSIIGSVACVPLAYIFPAMFHYKTHPDRKSRIIDISLLVFGVVTMIYTTGYTAYEWSKD